MYGKTNKYKIVKYLDYKYNEIIEESKNESSEKISISNNWKQKIGRLVI